MMRARIVWMVYHHRDRIDRTEARSASARNVRRGAASLAALSSSSPSGCESRGISGGACEANDGGRSE